MGSAFPPPPSPASRPASPAQTLALAACGLLFGFGLGYSAMVQPEIVLSFLRLQDAGLMLVLGAAVGVTALAYAWLPRWRATPLLGGRFERHPSQWGGRLWTGSAIFGAGWGLCGVCPGPAFAALGAGHGQLLWALAGIFAGAWLQGLLEDGAA